MAAVSATLPRGREPDRALSWPQAAGGSGTAEDRALRNVVREHLITALREGQLAQGTRIHETALARTLGVSLAPVREALFRLVEQGVLEHRPRRGFYVCVLGDSDIHEIYTVRALLEGFAARLIAEQYAAANAGAERLREGRRALEALIAVGADAGLAGDTLAVRDVNARFHDEVFKLAGHVLLRRLWVTLAPTTWLLTPGARLAPMTETAARDWVERHRRLLDALTSGDPAAAEREAALHVRAAGTERRERARQRADADEASRGGTGNEGGHAGSFSSRPGNRGGTAQEV
jgi:DNA-binding GntR family transcriptional regulator